MAGSRSAAWASASPEITRAAASECFRHLALAGADAAYQTDDGFAFGLRHEISSPSLA